MKFVHTADTHLGFEITRTPQGHPEGRERRGQGIVDNFLSIVDHAKEIHADLFIHSGDLFNKYYLPRDMLDRLVSPLFELDRCGVRVLIIPGNHERSVFPFDLFHGASGTIVFDEPKSITFRIDGLIVGMVGFPFIRNDSRRTFFKALEMTEYEKQRTDLNILITHQAFDSAVVGPGDFMFQTGRSDTVARHRLPLDFEYVAAGHIHRYQVLPHPLKPALKLVYPGSIQRMSFAERYEEKGFVEGELRSDRIVTRFLPLPVFQMELVEIDAAGMTEDEFDDVLLGYMWRFNEDMIIRFKMVGGARRSDYPAVDFEKIRMRMPPVLECQFAMETDTGWVFK